MNQYLWIQLIGFCLIFFVVLFGLSYWIQTKRNKKTSSPPVLTFSYPHGLSDGDEVVLRGCPVGSKQVTVKFPVRVIDEYRVELNVSILVRRQ